MLCSVNFLKLYLAVFKLVLRCHIQAYSGQRSFRWALVVTYQVHYKYNQIRFEKIHAAKHYARHCNLRN